MCPLYKTDPRSGKIMFYTGSWVHDETLKIQNISKMCFKGIQSKQWLYFYHYKVLVFTSVGQ